MQDHTEIEATRGRLAEQLMSDERILGAVPESAARLLLDRALAALDAAVTAAPDARAFAQTGEAIRRHARALADAAAEVDDPAATIAATPFPEVATVTPPEPVVEHIPDGSAPAGLTDAMPVEPPPPLEDRTVRVESPRTELPAPAEPASGSPSLWERLRGWWR